MLVRTIVVGVHVHAEPERLRATLAALGDHTGPRVEIILLPDGPDAATTTALHAWTGFRQRSTAEPRGAAACFNRLIAATDADVYVLLESGALPGPGWLEPLLAALADPANGLAGPSTNRSWNEQRLFPGAGGTPDHVAATAHLAAQRYTGQRRTLEPLYSLADFCYAVRRDVVERIGAADERYGLGPCWEMDYNLRAARAGFQGVWALDSYVYRSPFTPRRQREEAARFEASKRLYQDKFCGLRLRGEKDLYEPHCRGDACAHFAPAALIALKLEPPRPPVSEPEPAVEPVIEPLAVEPAADVPARVSSEEPAATADERVRVTDHHPLVSCIMPTRGRPEFVRQAITYFLRQDYPERELVIVYESDADLPRPLPADPRIVTLAAAPRSSIGAKRNAGIRQARGMIISQWDDDDWYADTRLSHQVAPILAGQADITGLEAGVFFDLDGWAFWRCTPALHRRLFVGDVHGGTLVFRRQVWERLGRYPDGSLGEDALFLRAAQRMGARLARLPNDGQFVYLRHGTNAWSFPLGRYLDPAGWQRTAEPPFPATDRAFYAAMHAPGTEHNAQGLPRVSCIMPTFNRRHYVPQAIAYFLRQDYPNRELLILDDGEEAVADLAPADPRIRYVRLSTRLLLGTKRNRACELAQGELIAHWDDDDWMAPHRLSRQVRALLAAGADLCGAPRQIYYDPVHDRAWLYQYAGGSQRYVAGNTLCYRRAFWQANPFPEIQVGEDTRFIWSPRARKLAATPDWDYYIGLLHANNTSPKGLNPPHWTRHPVEEVHRLMGEDLAFYRAQRALETAVT